MRAASTLMMTIILMVFFWLSHEDPISYPFKCIGFVRYHLKNGKDEAIFSVSQDVRLTDEKSGLVSFNGQVYYQNSTHVFHRTVHFVSGKKIGDDTYSFRVRNITRSPTDDTPQALFDLLQNEYTTSLDSLQIDLVPLRNGVWVIGSSSAFTSTCVAY